jgi:hypothetical protein
MGGRDGKVALLEIVPELIKNGIFLETTSANDFGLDSHIFASKATIDGMLYIRIKTGADMQIL